MRLLMKIEDLPRQARDKRKQSSNAKFKRVAFRPQRWRLAIDQAAATGQELVIVGFGAAGYCGLCTGQVTNATWVAWFKSNVEYANSKGVETSAWLLRTIQYTCHLNPSICPRLWVCF